MDAIRAELEAHPEHSNAPIWRAVLEHGTWGRTAWREAEEITRRQLEQRHKATTQQGEMF